MSASVNADSGASAEASVVISPEFKSILLCVAELHAKFYWHKKSSDISNLKKFLISISEKLGISLETMERVSLEHAQNYTSIFGAYKKIPYNTIESKRELTSINYISVPFVVYLEEDNTTCVVFRTSSSFIPEITPEMMDIIKYLGVVRVYISSKFKKAIPHFPDNVIQIQFDSNSSLSTSDEITFGMPQYLLGFYDLTKTYRTRHLNYTVRFPNTLVELTTSVLNTPNLPLNLVFLKYFVYYRDEDITLPESFFQMIPLSVKCLILAGFNCDMTDYTMNPGAEYLELNIGHVNGNIIRFDNVKTIRLNSFRTSVYSCPRHSSTKTFCNLVKIDEQPCDHCDDGTLAIIYELSNFTVSLGDTVSHLVLDMISIYSSRTISFNILNYLDASVPNNLEYLTIRHADMKCLIRSFEELLEKHQRWLEQSEDSSDFLNFSKTIINFHTRFPNVKIIFE